jgi:hypothetical protein
VTPARTRDEVGARTAPFLLFDREELRGSRHRRP